ncbi:MAG: hypothetical protein GC203_08415 [Phenylobacterium sp.]|uniref:Spy/CpxP family protein refolding chaperone n=1 Tax=Phenylobacterium sp. TaxID=1871053 RepID=UPI0025D13D7F|nr:Spy/CpxP family protein refolding chaperone [Phenylobacterium sp.]MBI1197873.1 hypothetical protein [Phenylobacterium sp.]
MMKFLTNPTPWLLGGAAILLAGVTPSLAGTPQEAERQAAQDARAAESAARDAAREVRREVRVWRDDDHAAAGAEDRAARLADLLQLRADQQPALKAFLEATRRDAGPDGDRFVRFDRDSQKSTLERLDAMQARMTEQQAEVSRRIAAIRSFYGQLDAKQQKAFDALPMLMMVGPSVGPMMIPHPMRISHQLPAPPDPPEPPPPPHG